MPEYCEVVKDIEKFYTGKCTVFETESYDDENFITNQNQVQVLKDIPCRLSYRLLNASMQSRLINYRTQGITLFLSNEYEIKPGSKIVVEQNGVKTEYRNSGQAGVYLNHQEIHLELLKTYC